MNMFWPFILTNVGSIFVALAVLCQLWMIRKLKERVSEIETKRTRFYESMADPNKIADEMEKGARLREMKDAHRTTLPREDAVGQNARVFRPKMQRKEPSDWNPKS